MVFSIRTLSSVRIGVPLPSTPFKQSVKLESVTISATLSSARIQSAPPMIRRFSTRRVAVGSLRSIPDPEGTFTVRLRKMTLPEPPAPPSTQITDVDAQQDAPAVLRLAAPGPPSIVIGLTMTRLPYSPVSTTSAVPPDEV